MSEMKTPEKTPKKTTTANTASKSSSKVKTKTKLGSPIPDLSAYPLLRKAMELMTVDQLKSRTTKGDMPIKSPSSKQDWIGAALMTAARRSKDDELDFADTTKLFKLMTADSKEEFDAGGRAMEMEWAAYCFKATMPDAPEFAGTTEETCPLLVRLIEDHMKSDQIKKKANKGDYPEGSTPALSTKRQKSVALLRTAAGRAANHMVEEDNRLERLLLLGDGFKELESLLTVGGKKALDELLANPKTTYAVYNEWFSSVNLKYFEAAKQMLTADFDKVAAATTEAEPEKAVKCFKATKRDPTAEMGIMKEAPATTEAEPEKADESYCLIT
jgi:hypothetical protein